MVLTYLRFRILEFPLIHQHLDFTKIGASELDEGNMSGTPHKDWQRCFPIHGGHPQIIQVIRASF